MKNNEKKSFLDNVKIKTGLYSILIVSICSFLLLGGFSYYTINSIKFQQEDMYANALIPIAEASEVKANIMESKFYITIITSVAYQQKYVEKIDTIDTEIRELLKKYESRNLDDEEKGYIQQVKSTYEVYNDNWNSIKSKLSSGEELNDEDFKNFDTICNNVDSAIDDMIAYGKSDADILRSDTDMKVMNSTKLFAYLFVTAIIAMVAITIAIINVIKFSIKGFAKNLDTISEGDFSLKIDTDSTNEFGLMRKQLGVSLDKIKFMIKSISTTSSTVDKQSDLLLELSNEIEISSKDVENIIQEVSNGALTQAENLTNINVLCYKLKLQKL